MNRLDISVREVAAPRLFTHLTSRPEMVAFMRGSVRGGVADLDEVRLIDNDDLGLDEWHVTLTDDASMRVLRWAVGAEVLVEVHSHGPLGRPAVFSATDLDGLASWVPHLMWRMPGIVYVSLVFAGGTFDGLAWRAGEAPTEIGSVALVGVGEWKSTARSLMRWHRTHRG